MGRDLHSLRDMKNFAARGFWAGTIATSTMTVAFFAIFRQLPQLKKSPLPPGTITDDLTEYIGVAGKLDSEDRQNAAMFAHYGYGFSMATVYSWFARNSRGNGVAKGSAFGMGVWAFSYLGLLPALQVRATAPRMPWQRNAMMIAAHLVWGATLGYTEERLRLAGKKMIDGRRKSLLAE